jgi:hypothetical protein
MTPQPADLVRKWVGGLSQGREMNGVDMRECLLFGSNEHPFSWVAFLKLAGM